MLMWEGLYLCAEDAAGTDVAASPVAVGRGVDAYAPRGAGVNELEGAVGFDVGDDTYMVDAASATAEEDEVAGLEVGAAAYGFALGDLLARGALQGDAEACEDVAGEARAIEGFRAAAADGVAGSDVALGGGDEIAGDAVEDDVVGDAGSCEGVVCFRLDSGGEGFDDLGQARLHGRLYDQEVGLGLDCAMTDGGVCEAEGAQAKQQTNGFLTHVFSVKLWPRREAGLFNVDENYRLGSLRRRTRPKDASWSSERQP